MRAPYLYALLNEWSDALVLTVGVSVGIAAVVGALRFLYGWSLKPLIYATLVPVIALSLYVAGDPQLATALGLAWDTGAVTTGPVTVPLVLSLGIGIAAAAGKGDSSLSGFGIVTLASLFPVVGVLLLLLFVASTSSPAEIIAGRRTGDLGEHGTRHGTSAALASRSCSASGRSCRWSRSCSSCSRWCSRRSCRIAARSCSASR